MSDNDFDRWYESFDKNLTKKLTDDHYPFAFDELLDRLEDSKILGLVAENIDKPDNRAETLLCSAVESDRIGLCKKLLELGCDADLNFTGCDPSELCIESEGKHSLEMLEMILKYSKYAIYDQHRSSGSTLLHQAVEFGRLDIARYLLNHGASLDDMDIDSERVRDVAIKKGGLDLLRKLQELQEIANP